jgi:hypothetical protein
VAARPSDAGAAREHQSGCRNGGHREPFCRGVRQLPFAVNVGLTVAGVVMLSLPPIGAELVGIATALLINFAFNVRVVFRTK